MVSVPLQSILSLPELSVCAATFSRTSGRASEYAAVSATGCEERGRLLDVLVQPRALNGVIDKRYPVVV